MRAVQFNEHGGPDVLHVGEVAEPHAGAGQVRVAVRAVGVNPIDWKRRSGAMAQLMPVGFPSVPAEEAAGVVDERGVELVDDEEQLVAVVCRQALDAAGQRAGILTELLRCDSCAWSGAKERRRELLEGLRAGNKLGDQPTLGTRTGASPQAREEPCFEQARLARAGGADDSQEAPAGGIGESFEQGFDQRLAAEEVVGVGLFERAKALVGIARNHDWPACGAGFQPERLPGRLDELAAAPVATLVVLRERPGDHGIETLGQPRGALARPGWVVLQVRPQELDPRGPRKRHLAGQALVEDAAERVHVGLRGDGLAFHLFRCDVLERADEPACVGAVLLLGAARQAEVGEVDVAREVVAGVTVEENVARLDIAMDQPLGVAGVEGHCHPLQDRKRVGRLESPPLIEQRLEIAALDVTHGEVEEPLCLPGFVDRDHLGLLERGREPRLTQEALTEALVFGELGRDELERHTPLEPGILGKVDDAHAASPEPGLEPVAGKLGADARIHFKHGVHCRGRG